MRKSRSNFAAMILLVLSAAIPTHAVDYAAFYQQIFARMAQGFSFQLSAEAQAEPIVWLFPGLPVPPVADPPTVDDLYYFSSVLNPVLNRGAIATERTELTPQVYDFILNSAVVGDSPLTASEQERFNTARAVLFTTGDNFSERYHAYWQYRGAYESALCALYTETAHSGNAAATLRAEVGSALKAWQEKGYKQVIETALADYRILLPRDKTWWHALRMRLDDQKTTSRGMTFYRTDTYPALDKWDTAGTWYTYRFNSKERPVAGATDNNVPLPKLGKATRPFSLNTNAETMVSTIARQSVNVSTNTLSCTAVAAKTFTGDGAAPAMDNIAISVQLKRINIVRPWLDETVFSAHNWKFGDAYQGKLVSTGDSANVRTPEMMPVLVVGVLLAKDLQIDATASPEALNALLESTTIIEKANPGAAIGFGPFSIAGKPRSNNVPMLAATLTGESNQRLYAGGLTTPYVNVSTRLAAQMDIHVHMPGMQILGYFVSPLPKSPDPAPGVHFP